MYGTAIVGPLVAEEVPAVPAVTEFEWFTVVPLTEIPVPAATDGYQLPSSLRNLLAVVETSYGPLVIVLVPLNLAKYPLVPEPVILLVIAVAIVTVPELLVILIFVPAFKFNALVDVAVPRISVPSSLIGLQVFVLSDGISIVSPSCVPFLFLSVIVRPLIDIEAA